MIVRALKAAASQSFTPCGQKNHSVLEVCQTEIDYPRGIALGYTPEYA